MNKRFAVASVVAASLLVAACSDDKKESTATPAPTTEAMATATTEAMAPATTEAMAPATTGMAEPGDIVAVASGNADFSTLVAAVQAAGLVETLQGEGPFTVFAPTNEAFAALPAGLVDKLLLPENKDILVKILTYHVVSAKVMAADVMAGDVASVEGSPITISIVDGKVMLNGSATVVTTDIATSNGVIHVIDTVILPPDVDISSL